MANSGGAGVIVGRRALTGYRLPCIMLRVVSSFRFIKQRRVINVYKTNLAAEDSSAQARTRLSGADGNQGRTQGVEGTPRAWSAPVDRDT